MRIGERISALTELLAELDDRWRGALLAVPRHLFIPERAWVHLEDGAGYPIDRTVDEEKWLDAVYSNEVAIITQLDDGRADIATGQGEYTSSCSSPDVVVWSLDLLDPYQGDVVLEIGTGTGWTAGLLAHVLGDENVTSVEIDRDVSASATENLRSAGHSPSLVVGDGAVGWPEGAPYDRVHVTAGVTSVPYAWVEQTRPGGLIVMPWMPRWEGGHLTCLAVTGDGTAVGRFHRGVRYMPLRSQRVVHPGLSGSHRESATLLDPRRVVRSSTGADIAIAGMLPAVYGSYADDEEGGGFRLWLWSEDSDAQARYAPGYERVAVFQRGPRDLWDELEAAYLRWVSLGMPDRDRFGLMVTPEGQHVWLDRPDNPVTLGRTRSAGR